MSVLKEWWSTLGLRERRMLIGGGLVLAIVLPYGVVWAPLVDRNAALSERVEGQRAELLWMQQAAQQVQAARGAAPTARAGAGEQSLLSLIDSTAKDGPLGAALTRVQPEGQAVRVWLDNAPFDDLMLWLARLQEEYAVQVTNLAVERQQQAGRVGARVVLQQGGAA
ncbi:type II secretion system protein M [Ectothiorhodospiraceae bacterium 2226]|nr:type II secretion system protein M [Ectothiorhodospiraceae bacterium 2226]